MRRQIKTSLSLNTTVAALGWKLYNARMTLKTLQAVPKNRSICSSIPRAIQWVENALISKKKLKVILQQQPYLFEKKAIEATV